MCDNVLSSIRGWSVAWGMGALVLLGSAVRVGAEDKADATPLPLSKIVLFNSGVGYYQHDAEVSGDQKVDLKFNISDVNDLLKSMVLQDMGGGKISTVTYNSMDPVTKTLKTFAIDLTSNPSLSDILGQVRGEKVEIEAPAKIVGTILGLEKRREKVKDDEAIEVTYLNLLTDDGIRSLSLPTVSRIKLVNEKLDSELRQALTVLALGNSTDKKTVTLSFQGHGKRPVRVGYIQQSPVWKTSYRLVLSDKKEPYLQGWAIVENTTEEDWKDVNLSLVSGRPISFVMNLYQPLYLERPEVVPELFANLRPQVYGQDLGDQEREFAERGAMQRQLATNSPPSAPPGGQGMGGGMGGGGGFFGSQPKARKAAPLNLEQGVQSVAQGGDVGELFQYSIESPVTLPRQQSAMLPIVQGSVQGEKLSIYNPAVQPKHPLNGLRLKNTTGLHLMQGPMTVFDEGAIEGGATYAGDAQIHDLQPDTERLLSYALDLDTEVAFDAKGGKTDLVSVTIKKGAVHTIHKQQRSRVYTVKNSGSKTKKVLIEYPIEQAWTLVEPKQPSEKTRDLYRFAVQAEPGQAAKLNLSEELIQRQMLALNNLDDATIQFYINSKEIGNNVKSALVEVAQRKSAFELLTGQLQQLRLQVQNIDEEQKRIRQNMGQLDRASDLYNRYVKKFSTQEDQIEKLREKIASLQIEIDSARKAFDDYLRNLDVS